MPPLQSQGGRMNMRMMIMMRIMMTLELLSGLVDLKMNVVVGVFALALVVVVAADAAFVMELYDGVEVAAATAVDDVRDVDEEIETRN